METTTAVILAAGYGSRLDAPEGHKLMVTIGGRTMLAHHAESLGRLGVDRLVVVTGHRGDVLANRVRDFDDETPIEVRPVHNPRFDAGNGLSVLAGARAVADETDEPGPFWLTMSDHLYDPAMFDGLADRVRNFDDDVQGALVVDPKLETIFDMPDATKVRTGPDFAIGKQLEDFDAVDTGLFWCGPGFVRALRAARDDRGDCSTSDAVRALQADGRFRFVDIGDHLWQDVDTPEARDHARRLWNHHFSYNG